MCIRDRLSALHLSDDAIDVLKAGKFNPRLLSEIISHHDFQKMMLDAEIYVDRIADMRISDMNAVLQAVRQMVLMQQGETENDLAAGWKTGASLLRRPREISNNAGAKQSPLAVQAARGPVSYTHLDVYKRQAPGGPPKLPLRKKTCPCDGKNHSKHVQ